MRNPDGVEFTFILIMLAFGFIVFGSLGIPFVFEDDRLWRWIQ